MQDDDDAIYSVYILHRDKKNRLIPCFTFQRIEAQFIHRKVPHMLEIKEHNKKKSI